MQFFCQKTIITIVNVYIAALHYKNQNKKETMGPECSPAAKKLSLTVVNVYIALHYKSQNKKWTLLKKYIFKLNFIYSVEHMYLITMGTMWDSTVWRYPYNVASLCDQTLFQQNGYGFHCICIKIFGVCNSLLKVNVYEIYKQVFRQHDDVIISIFLRDEIRSG